MDKYEVKFRISSINSVLTNTYHGPTGIPARPPRKGWYVIVYCLEGMTTRRAAHAHETDRGQGVSSLGFNFRFDNSR